MNSELIKQLMTQAGFDPAAIERMGVMPNAERFAELIVRECIRSIENTIEIKCDTDGEKIGCEFAIVDLIQHFGVE